jgi:hypothetical protein
MKIRIIKELLGGPAHSIKAGTELYGRIVEMDPLCKMFQCTDGQYIGREIPYKFYVEIAEDKTFAELRVIELEQTNLMLLEGEKVLNRNINSLVDEARLKSFKHKLLDEELGETLNRLQKAEVERDSALATLERAMLDHQPVVLPKKQVDAIDFFKNPPKGIYTNWSNGSIVSCVLYKGKYINDYELPLSALREIDFDILLKALVNGYTVEETAEDKVLNYFKTVTPKDWKYTGDAHDPVYIARDAIRTTCIILGKEIEGINSKI